MSGNPNPTVCGNCGTKNPPDTELCVQCGTPLTSGDSTDESLRSGVSREYDQEAMAGAEDELPSMAPERGLPGTRRPGT